jgi:hypothetical protein
MKHSLLIILLIGCSHNPPKEESEKLVSLRAALMQAQASYLKGCVDALKELKIPLAFHGCRDKATLHWQELEKFFYED